MISEQALLKAAVHSGLVDDEAVNKARNQARMAQSDVLTTLSYAQRIPLVKFYRAYAHQQGVRFLNAAHLHPDIQLARKLGYGVIRSRGILPLASRENDSGTVVLVSAALPDAGLRRQVERALGGNVEYCLAENRAISTAMQQLERVFNPTAAPSQDAQAEAFDPVDAIQEIVDQAYLYRASDIHIQPLKDNVRIRMRVDGHLQEYVTRYTHEQANGLLSRIKVLSDLDIAETRMPQDGGLRHRTQSGVEFDIRVATMPTKFGERATLRLLGSGSQTITLPEIGMSDTDFASFRETIERPHGMILITGPTGSGKSTTLYAALQEISSDDTNILTAEDPVEQGIESISQLQVGVKVNFASALRSFLRHDPDVIMVGEIRDGETADVAIKAAMTGHLVFSTLHTNTAVGCISRLRDMEVEAYLIGSTLLAAIAQRLVRRLCRHCKQPMPIPETVQEKLSVATDAESTLHEPQGCARCSDTGYEGRIALFETLWIDDAVRRAIYKDVTETEILDVAQGFTDMRTDGQQKLLQGHTSVEEIQKLGLL